MLGDPNNIMGLKETSNYSPGTARRLRQKISCLFSSKDGQKPVGSNNNIIETDYLQGISDEQEQSLRERGIYTSQDDISLSLTDSSSPYGYSDENTVDESKWKAVSSKLRSHLRAETSKLHLDLFVPNDLLERIAKDVVRMSCCEPYGLRGCSLFVNLQKKSSCAVTKLSRVECDSNTVSTFELHLTLIEDKKRWYSFKDLIAPVLPGCLNESQALEVFISPGYRLVKNKLYRPNN